MSNFPLLHSDLTISKKQSNFGTQNVYKVIVINCCYYAVKKPFNRMQIDNSTVIILCLSYSFLPKNWEKHTSFCIQYNSFRSILSDLIILMSCICSWTRFKVCNRDCFCKESACSLYLGFITQKSNTRLVDFQPSWPTVYLTYFGTGTDVRRGTTGPQTPNLNTFNQH